ncbi:putative MFS drug transporter [Aaosphaeria arxii CBS 175.79]|uniref:Putative MFS drug transporter n=1 Tax=Aaosphaeria arxii CBS 175.79 TaxID=1450172 RepID=A0A6A5XAR7_9PLEO|nr:putative MFS drug transporter [Aaosphaeria arxii CBS 175.79]KAF2010003.1 putative MFS drug transporter [Aaosphaeria arxii CBS 175.79]
MASSNETDEPSSLTDQTGYVKPSRIVMIFLTCASVDLVALMDQTTLAASLSSVSRALGTSTSFQLLYGRLSDIWSRKTVLLCCMFLFFIGSLAASLAQTTTQLIAFRAITGVGGGGLMTLAQTIVSDVVSLRERGKYQGILGAVVALANGIGPIIGASLTSISPESWRWIFRLNLPLTAVSTVAIVYMMPLKRVQGSWIFKLKAIDFAGALLTLTASTCLVLSLTWAGIDHPWHSAAVITPLILGVVLLAAFVIWEGIGPKYPLMPLHIFRNPLVIGICTTMFINGWLFVTQIYYIPAFFQLAYGLSPMKSGALLLPITLMQTVSSTFSGLIVHWTGRYRESIIIGWVSWTVGLGLYSTLDTTHFDLGKAIGYGLLTGFGVGQTLQPSLIAIQAGVARQDMAVITCTRNFVRNLGSTLGLAVAATLISSSLQSRVTGQNAAQVIDDPEAYLSMIPEGARQAAQEMVLSAYSQGFRHVFYLNAALSALAALLAWTMISHINLDRPDDAALNEQRDLETAKKSDVQ